MSTCFSAFIAVVVAQTWLSYVVSSEYCDAITGSVIHQTCSSTCEDVSANVEWTNYTTDYPQITDCAPDGVVSCSCDTDTKLAVCRTYELPNCEGSSYISEYIHLANDVICNANISCFIVTRSLYNKSLENGCFENNKYSTDPPYYQPLMSLDTCYIAFSSSYTFRALWNCDDSVLKIHSYAAGCPTTLAPASVYSTCVENNDNFVYKETSVDVCLNAPTSTTSMAPNTTSDSCLYPSRLGSFGCCTDELEPNRTTNICSFYNGCIDEYNTFCKENDHSAIPSYDAVQYEYYICDHLTDSDDFDLFGESTQLWITQMITCLQNNIMEALSDETPPITTYTCSGIDSFAYNLHSQCYLGSMYSSVVDASYLSICALNTDSSWDLLLDAFLFVDQRIEWRMIKQLLSTINDCVDKYGFNYADDKRIYEFKFDIKTDYNTIYALYNNSGLNTFNWAQYFIQSVFDMNLWNFDTFGISDQTYVTDVSNASNNVVEIRFIYVTNNPDDVQTTIVDKACDHFDLESDSMFIPVTGLMYDIKWSLKNISFVSPLLNETNFTLNGYCTPIPTMNPTNPPNANSVDSVCTRKRIWIIAFIYACTLLLLFIY